MPSGAARISQYLDLFEDGLEKVFNAALKPHALTYKKWLRTDKAKNWTESEQLVTAFGPMPEKREGTVFTTDRPYLGIKKDFTLVPYGLGFLVTYEAAKWELYGAFSKVTKKLARSGNDRKQRLTHDILNNSFSAPSATYQTYASENLISTAHALLRAGAGTAKNAPSTASALAYLAVIEALTDFKNLPDEDGLYIQLSPKSIVCAPKNEWVAKTLLKSTYRPDNANMAYNAVGEDDSLSMYYCSPYLDTSADAWWLLAKPGDLECSFVVGEDLNFRQESQPSTWSRVFVAYMAARVHVYHWYGFWGANP